MTPTLGTIVRRLRQERGWKLAEMSEATGIPISTLSKIENDKLTLSYDKLQQLARSLKIPLGALFADAMERGPSPKANGRRSIATLERAVKISTSNYEYAYFCGELRHRRMIPIYTRVTARTIEEFGDLVRHSGEEFVYVIEGGVELHSEFYEPVVLNRGEGAYIDSTMGHAYVVPPEFDEAVMLVVCASGDDSLQEELIAEASARAAEVAALAKPGALPMRQKPRSRRSRAA
jgi:transcriptional regulator with XRE-family HTH domain